MYCNCPRWPVSSTAVTAASSLSSCVGGPELASTGGLVSVVSPPPQVTVRDVRVRGLSVSEWL